MGSEGSPNTPTIERPLKWRFASDMERRPEAATIVDVFR
jgi:hypothetical protein